MDVEPDLPAPFSPRRLLTVFGIDQAVFFAIALRVWQLLAGAGTIVLITLFFSPQLQGYYYTFASLVALQTFFELGFNIVVINVCSHEWAGLRLDKAGRLAGDARARSRLISFGRLLFRWYGVAQVLFVLAVGAGGYWFLGLRGEVESDWQSPWFALVAASGLLLWTLPFLAVLEGCNQVATVNRFRLIQAVLANISVWTVMALGGGLWAAVAATGARLVCDLYLLLVHYRRFFAAFFRPPAGAGMPWRSEVWPMQWRLAVGGVFSYFAYFLFTPVMFQYHGAAMAGRMGMTWTVVTAIQAAALAWVQTRVPRFGMLIQGGRFAELDRLFMRMSLLATAAMAVAGAAFWLLLAAVYQLDYGFAARLLSPLTTALFLAAALVQLVAGSLVFYVRAHKQEPFLLVSIISNCLVGLGVWLLGARYGPGGAAVALLAEGVLFTLPTHFYIWRRCRLEWH